MAGIDTRILIVGLPVVAKSLGADVNQVIWISQSYLLASTVGLLIIGRVTDVVGKIKIFLIGFVVFTIGSAFASLAQSPAELIIARIVQGVGAAILISDGAAILTDSTPNRDLGLILGINQVALKTGAILGLTLSGLILSIASWQALFYINIPIGILGTIWSRAKLKELSVKDTSRQIDWLGFIHFTSAIILILVSISLFSYGLSSDSYFGLGAFVAGAILLIIFVRLEGKVRTPLLDLTLFKIRAFAIGNATQFLESLSWFGFIILLTFYMQVILNYSPFQAGLGFIPVEVAVLIAGPISGHLSDRHGPRALMTIGLIFSSLGLIMSTFLATTSGYWEIAVILGLEGVGYGVFFSPNSSSIMSSVPANRRGVASAFRNTVGNVGLTASAGIAILLITTGISYSSLSSLIENIAPQSALMLLKEEFVNGFRITCIVLAILNCVAVVLAAFPLKEAYVAVQKTPEL
ncbi:MAG: MFS transporter, partial [Thaumarchaeota archaeon]|nr:MFS transporter [Nitrososphaerota archaeon]